MLKKPLCYWKIINNLSDYYYDDEVLLVRNRLKKKTSTRRFFSKHNNNFSHINTNSALNKNNNISKIRSFSKFDLKRLTNHTPIKMTKNLDETKTIIEDKPTYLKEDENDYEGEEEPSFVVLKVNVRLNILNKNEAIRQKDQSLIMKVPVEKLNNQATLDINLEDGVELANIDIIEMDQDLELAEIDIIKLDKDQSLTDKIAEVLNTKTNENAELIDKLASELKLEQIKFQQAEEDKRADELKREQELLEEILNDELNEIEAELKEKQILIEQEVINRTEKEQDQTEVQETDALKELEVYQEQYEEQPAREDFDYVPEKNKQDEVEEEEEEFQRRNSLSFRNKSDRLDLLKLEKIIEEEEGTFGSSTEWEEEIEWEEEEADWDTNENENEIKEINQSANTRNDEDDEEERQWEKFDSELDSLLEPIWSQKDTNTFSSSYSPINVGNQNNMNNNNLKDNSLDYDEEEEYFTDLEDKTVRTTPSSFDEWDDFGTVGKTPESTTNNRQNIAIENKLNNLDEKTLLSTIENIFQLLDYDQNGMIEFNDIIRVVFILNYLLGRNYSKTDAVIFFTTLDQDKDGKLNRREFKNAFNFLF